MEVACVLIWLCIFGGFVFRSFVGVLLCCVVVLPYFWVCHYVRGGLGCYFCVFFIIV